MNSEFFPNRVSSQATEQQVPASQPAPAHSRQQHVEPGPPPSPPVARPPIANSAQPVPHIPFTAPGGLTEPRVQQPQTATTPPSNAIRQPAMMPPPTARPAVQAKQPTRPQPDRRQSHQPKNRLLGNVIAVDGGYATLATTATKQTPENSEFWSIGRLVSISVEGAGRIIGLVFKTGLTGQSWSENSHNGMHVFVELIGEITESITGQIAFSRGINTYPPIGSLAHRIRANDLAIIHHPQNRKTATIGTLSQDSSIPAVVSIDDMIKRHFAIVGSTGTGKSTSVSLLLREVVKSDPDLRVLILDPHNEYAGAFPNQTHTISTDTLELPFWLFQHEEFCEVVFRGRKNVAEEIETLRDLIPVAKQKFAHNSGQNNSLSLRRTSSATTITADTPIPYRMTDLFALIDEEIGQLDGRHDRATLKSLQSRLVSLVNDPRYRFMFAQRTIADNMQEIVGGIFRVPINAKPITTFQLAGMPSDVVNSVVSVLCRLAFDLAVWSKGSCKVLVLCEEAHRYVPQDHSQGFGPTRQSIARIAKEGRKYGAYLGIVTQRPGELDPTILSQCSTVFAMRLANDNDQEIIRSAISDSSASTLSFLSSIGNQEAIAFGEGIATPMRMRFANLPPQYIPGSATTTLDPAAQSQPMNLETVISAMRSMHDRG